MATGMNMTVPVCVDMRVNISRMVVMIGWHRGGMARWLWVMLRCWYVAFVCLWAPSWRSVLVSISGQGLKLYQGDDGGRSGRVRSPGRWSFSLLWTQMTQGGLGLISAILKYLGPLSVGSKRSLGEVCGIRLGRRMWRWCGGPLARLAGTMLGGLCVCAQALWCLDWCCYWLLGHMCLLKVIRISQSSCICPLRCRWSL